MINRTAIANAVLSLALSALMGSAIMLAAETKRERKAPSEAEPVKLTGTLDGHLLTGGPGGFAIYDSTGKVIRSYKTRRCDEGSMLANGNALLINGEQVLEMGPDGKVVWEYTPEELKGGGTFSAQRLPNGNTLVGENSSGKIVEVDEDGKVVFELQTPHEPGSHNNMRYVRKLDNGHYLVCHKLGGVKEYATDSTVVWEPTEKAPAYHAIRTPSGTTLVSTMKDVREYDKAGEVIWLFDPKEDLPHLDFLQNKKYALCGLHLLENGNIVIGIYSRLGSFEITKDKKLVWRLANKAQGLMVQKLSTDNKLLTDNPLR